MDWIQLGDSNTKFFHAYAKVRQNANAIHRLVRTDGTVCLGQEQLKREVRSFYIQLVGQAVDSLEMKWWINWWSQKAQG